jgi:hypothetical protein
MCQAALELRATPELNLLRTGLAGLTDFSWSIISKGGIYQNHHKIYQFGHTILCMYKWLQNPRPSKQ